MCGNFGLLLLNHSPQTDTYSAQSQVLQNNNMNGPKEKLEDETMLMAIHNVNLLKPLEILRAQAACTEIRGGQAGGISCLEFESRHHITPHKIFAERDFIDLKDQLNPHMTRVRCVTRKRHNLADDLVHLFETKGRSPNPTSIISFLGHTRFATSSINREIELHPHEWCPFKDEVIWMMNPSSQRFERVVAQFGVHISHNGDFDALACYNQFMMNEDIGLWLERVLHVPNDLLGDSPKIAGCVDLMRVQGRWAAAARLAYVRCINHAPNDVCSGEQLSKHASNSFPDAHYWKKWEIYFEEIWMQHINNVIVVMVNPSLPSKCTYIIDRAAELQLIDVLCSSYENRNINNEHHLHAVAPDISNWSDLEFKSFVSMTVKGFLNADLYTTMTEFMSRAEGIFGVQVHCTIEPGVVVITSKGQPMSISFDEEIPLVLFGSEAEAIAIPVTLQGKWLSNRIDLDSHGEVLRIGAPKLKYDGTFNKSKETSSLSSFSNRHQMSCYLLKNGIELRSYILKTASEESRESLILRTKSIQQSPVPYNPALDLIALDIKDIPTVLRMISESWSNKSSSNYISAMSLAEKLIENQSTRKTSGEDCTDLLIGGVEASLWVAEQFATDLRMVFPSLNITTVSANKLLSVGENKTDKILDSVLPRKISERTCVLLLSQSGQTFPTLHATRKLSRFVKGNIWILTGCRNSKMEDAIKDAYAEMEIPYKNDRVIDNLTGCRPAEPTSVAIIASTHSLTLLLMTIMQHALNEIKVMKDANKKTRIVGRDSIVKSLNIKIKMEASQQCLNDLNSIISSCLVHNASDICGYDSHGNRLINTSCTTHHELVKQGKVWAEHVSEPWNILVLTGVYIFFSVGLGLPIFGLLSDLIVYIINGGNNGNNNTAASAFIDGVLSFSPRNKLLLYSQPSIYSLIGLLIQCTDALWFIFLCKILTWIVRYLRGRPIYARHGKRTLVIVDSPWVHQLVEIFVSKLFSQSYSFVSIDVHGASGLDHFVHRFTHRVVRGVLLAVGRPDGRLTSLAKTECAVILSVKQAAFIQNPAYLAAGSGPDIVTIGHNPFVPNFGSKHSNITLPSGARGKFVDEILYDRLHESEIPMTGIVLRSHCPSIIGEKCGEGKLANVYGAHFVERIIYKLNFGGNIADFILSAKKKIDKRRISINFDAEWVDTGNNVTSFKNSNPSLLMAFESKLDEATKECNGLQSNLQQFYENRIAALERYMSFCVMFHALASSVNKPFLCTPWDLARSQSNLRIATTASPVPSENGENHAKENLAIKKMKRKFHSDIRGFKLHF